MTVEESIVARERAELMAEISSSLCTRTLNQFAAESRADGESLADALERYEIDYAWHVLGSERMRDETLSLLEARLGRPASDAQKARIGEALQASALAQPTESLMSFDNDVPERLAARLHALHHVELRAAADALG